MHILVTGGGGFIGSHLVDALIAAGHEVRVLDKFDPQVHGDARPAYLHPTVEYIEGPVQDRGLLIQSLQGIDRVYHEAAAVGVGQSMYQIQQYVGDNTYATAVLLDVLVNEKHMVKKLVVASSMSIYGEGLYQNVSGQHITPVVRPDAQLERHDWEMRDPADGTKATPLPTPEWKSPACTSIYAASKYDQEEMCLMVGRAYKIPTVALRYFNVYGTRQSLSNPYTGVCAIFSSRIKNDHAPLIYEDGNQSRDFIHVSDIVRANILVMERDEANYEVFNVGTGRPTTVKHIAEILIKLYGKSLTPEIVGKFRSGDIRHCIGDVSKLKALGFEPHVQLEEGLQALVEWGEQQDSVDRVDAAAKELEDRGLVS